ncbi:MAG TPA: hypothetical protein VMY18_00485, partial [Acidobacteriota bacterium]|nr:hypothetical protein [Acidobacteriota bacterium]
MSFKRLVTLLSGFLAFSCSGPTQTEQETPQVGIFEEAPCPVQFPEPENKEHAARCGYVTVPEFHGDPNGRTLRLAVAVFPGTGDTVAPEPLVIAPPGPGTSAIANIGPEVASGVGAPLRVLKDVVLIENRGLPLSEPALMCEEIVDSAFDRLQQNLSAEETLDLQVQSIRAC